MGFSTLRETGKERMREKGGRKIGREGETEKEQESMMWKKNVLGDPEITEGKGWT